MAAAGAKGRFAALIVQNLQPDPVDFFGRGVRLCSFALLADDFVGYGARIERQSAVVTYGTKFRDQLDIQFQAHQAEQLRVAVLVHHIDPVVRLMKSIRCWVNGYAFSRM